MVFKKIRQTTDEAMANVFQNGYDDGYAAGQWDERMKLEHAKELLRNLMKEIENCVEDGTLPQESVDSNEAVIAARCFLY